MTNEVDLIRDLVAGDSAALAVIFETHADRVYRLALSWLRDPAQAEDVVQDTFLAAILHLDRFEGRSSLGTWLYRVAYNASMDRLRTREDRSLPPDGDEEPLPRSIVQWRTDPEAALSSSEALEKLNDAIERLPGKLRIVFIMRDIEEFSTAETAEALEITAGAVKVDCTELALCCVKC